MTRLRRYALAAGLAAGITALPLAAQDSSEETSDDSGGLLVNFLENTLSTDSRYISVTGLEGALSSQASIERLTVADEKGVWLTIEGAVLDWNRLALVRGRFSVNALTVDSITVDRAPEPVPEDPSLPAPEATPFQLPELPVAIEIGKIEAGRINLGQELAGTAASLSLGGQLQLADGSLNTDLSVARLDKPGDRLHLDAGFSNETRVISLDMVLEEAAGGLVSRVLQLPGQPNLRFSAQGTGPLTGFDANIELDSNDARRLTGTVSLAAAGAAAAEGAESDSEPPKGIRFAADLNGDIDPLLLPAYRPFFGPGLRAGLRGQTGEAGGVTLDSLVLRTQALQLTGAVAVAQGGVLETANIRAAITPPEGQAAVILPVAGASTTLAGADILAQKTAENDWRISGRMQRLTHPAATIGEASFNGEGTLDQSDGFEVQGRLSADLKGFAASDPALAQATGDALTFTGTVTTDGPEAVSVTEMELRGADYQAAGDVSVAGLQSGLKISADITAGAADLARFSGLAGQDLGGAVQAQIKGSFTALTGAFEADAAVRAQDLSAGIDQVDPLIAGATTLDVKAARGADGIRIDRFILDGTALEANASGQLNSTSGQLDLAAKLKKLELVLPQSPGTLAFTAGLERDGDRLSGTAELQGPQSSYAKLDGDVTLQGQANVAFDASMDNLERFVPQLPGRIGAEGTASRDAGQWQVAGTVRGPGGIAADAKGSFDEATGDLEAVFDAAMQELERLVPQLAGAVQARGSVSRSGSTWKAAGNASGPGGFTADLDGSFDGESGMAEGDFDIAMQELERLVPALPGAVTAKGSASRSGGKWQATADATAPAGTTAKLDATLDEASGDADINFDAAVQQLQGFLPDLPGQLTAKGSASRSGSLWQIDSDTTGPAGIEALLAGTWDQASGDADMTAKGSLRLEGANPFIAPNLLQGAANFDLALRGQPALESLSGSISTSGSTLAMPGAGQQIEDISATISLEQARATIQMSARPRDGGQITLNGPVALEPPFNGDLRVVISNVVLSDHLSFDTSLNGNLAFTGAFAGSSQLTGRIDVGETNINLATAGGSVTSAPVPPIHHVHEPAAVHTTRVRAGFIDESGGGGSAGGPDIGLDIVISAPSRIFARGRGLNAELGGEIRVRGSVASLAPSGQISLIRGTFDIFGRRLDLDEGRVTLQGDLKPYIEFRSSADTSEGTASLELSGLIDAPEIKVTSDPPRPSEEALALLLFGDNIQDLSPLALARMAASIRELSGGGGKAEGKVRDGTGADNVDLGFDNLGAGLLGIGGYVSENIYTDFNVNTRGESELTINLDVSKSFTLKGTVDSEGETGIGAFFKRDY